VTFRRLDSVFVFRWNQIDRTSIYVQGDSERWTQFQLAIFPELYVVFEFCIITFDYTYMEVYRCSVYPPPAAIAVVGGLRLTPMVLFPHVCIPVFYQVLIVGIVYCNDKCSSPLEAGCSTYDEMHAVPQSQTHFY
jgi:hypothetical protein